MATYYVAPSGSGGSNSNNGSTDSPWLTLTYAHTQIANGDTVRVRAGTYNETLRITKTNVTFIADNSSNKPVLDGGYHIGLLSGTVSKSGTVPDPRGGAYLNLNGSGKMVSVNGAGSTFDGFVVQNVAGDAISLGASDTTVQNCEVFWAYQTGIVSNETSGGGLTGLTIHNNVLRFCSIMIFDPNRNNYISCSRQCVTGTLKVGNAGPGTTISSNEVAYGFGEGINVGKYNYATAGNPMIVEDNIVHDCNHTGIYLNASRFVHVRRNIIYSSNVDLNLWDGDAPPGIKFYDEKETSIRDCYAYNNLIVNMGVPIFWGGRHTASTGCYFGYNTVVGGPLSDAKPKPAVHILAQDEGGTASQRGLFENNLIDYSMTTADIFRMTGVSGAAGVGFRNNAWSTQPAAAGRSTSDVYGALKLVRPTAALSTSNYVTKANTTAASLTISDNFDVDNYRLYAASPAIGGASNRSTFNGITPPTITTDNQGDTRDDEDSTHLEFYDIGALEYGATGGTTDSVTANFTQSHTTGVAPLTVTFTSTSTAAGAAVIDSLAWNPGNGTAVYTSSPFVFTYSEPGTYTPTLTAYDTTRGLSDIKTGSTITVVAPPTGSGPGVFDVVRFALPTTATEKTIAFNLGGHAPAQVLLFMTKALAAGAAVDDAMLCFGAVSETEQWAFVLNSNDGEGTTVTESYATTSACLVSLTDGAVTGKAVKASIAADRLVINCTDAFPAAYLCTAVAFAGAQWKGRARDFLLGVEGQITQLLPGFVPELMLFGGGGASVLDTVEANADFSFGVADGTRQYGFSWRDANGEATSKVKASISSDGQVIRQAVNRATANFSDYNAGKLEVVGGDIGRRFGYAALDIPGDTTVEVRQFSTPTATGVQSYNDYNFQPAGLLMLFSSLNTQDVHDGSSAAAEGFAIVAVDSGATFSTAIASSQAAAATNSKSRVDNSLVVINGAGTTILAGTVALTATGFDINWTTVQADARHFIAVAVGETAAIAGPIPRFEADTTTPSDGVVQFNDLSSPNGAAITAWEWDLGDGTISTEQNPEHTYTDFGTFTVSLTVTNANGSETVTRVNYIRYTEPDSWLLFLEPRSITYGTHNRMYGNDPAHPYYGYHEHELNTYSIQIDAYPDPDDDDPVAGKLRGLADLANNRIKFILPDGTIKYLSFDA